MSLSSTTECQAPSTVGAMDFIGDVRAIPNKCVICTIGRLSLFTYNTHVSYVIDLKAVN